MRRIERQEVTEIQPKTKERLEVALLWDHGVVDRIVAGTVTDEELHSQTIRARSIPPDTQPDQVSPFAMAAGLVAFLSHRGARSSAEANALNALVGLMGEWTERGHELGPEPRAR